MSQRLRTHTVRRRDPQSEWFHWNATEPYPVITMLQPSSTSTAEDAALPTSVTAAILPCVQTCLLANVSEGYLCDSSDLFCLCQNYSSSGYTLGELALICLEEQCPTSDSNTVNVAAAYNLCAGVSNDVVPTHQTLTVAVASTSTSNPEPTSQSISSSSWTTKHTLTSTSMLPALTTTMLPTNAVQTSTASSSSGSSNNDALPTGKPVASHENAISSGQVVAISIGAMIAVLSLVAFVLLLACLCRRRREGQWGNHGPLADTASMSRPFKRPAPEPLDLAAASTERSMSAFDPPSSTFARSPRRIRERASSFVRPIRQSLLMSAQSLQRARIVNILPVSGSSRQRNASRQHGQGGQLKTQPSVASWSSMRKLLPMHHDSPHPASPQQIIHHHTLSNQWPNEQQSPYTHYSPDDFGTRDAIPASIAARSSLDYIPTRSPPPVPVTADRPKRPLPPPMLSPALVLSIPQQAPRPPPVLAGQASNTFDGSHNTNNTPKSSISDKPARYTAANSIIDHYANSSPLDHYYPAPGDESRPSAFSASTVTSPPPLQHPRRPSSSSDTSFESNATLGASTSSEEMSTDHDTIKTPRTPLSALRYPKVPRGAAQVVPRSPTPGRTLTPLPQGGHEYAGSSKSPIEVNSAARPNNHSPLRLKIDSQMHRQREIGPIHEQLASPPWEPKLTPRKEGNDLFIGVSDATRLPHKTAFPRKYTPPMIFNPHNAR